MDLIKTINLVTNALYNSASSEDRLAYDQWEKKESTRTIPGKIVSAVPFRSGGKRLNETDDMVRITIDLTRSGSRELLKIIQNPK